MKLEYILLFLLNIGTESTKVTGYKLSKGNVEYVKSYCGIGYDLVAGNPLGDPSNQGDFGYKSTIIVQPTITRDNYGNFKVKGNTKGFWIRKNNYCWDNAEPGEIRNNDDYLKALYNDFNVDNALSNDLLKANSSNKIIRAIKDHGKYRIRKSYCSIYESGIVLPYKGILNKGFQEYMDTLPVLANDISECSADLFIAQSRSKECANIRKWISFFKIYGTHIVTHVVTGGKVIYAEKSANISELSREDKNVTENPNSTTVKFNKRIRSNRESKQVLVLGGYYIKGLEDRKNFSEWMKTISERPMPIKAKFTAISYFFPDRHPSYLQALKYYSDILGLGAGLSIIENVGKMFEGVALTSNSGPASCPVDKYTIAGFSIKVKKTLEITSCIQGRDICPGSLRGSVWLLCGNSSTEDVITLSFTKEEPRCPQGFTIALGFYIDYKKYETVKCRPDNICGYYDWNNTSSWLMCVPDRATNETRVVSGMASSKSTEIVECPKGYKIEQGFVINIENTVIVGRINTRVIPCQSSASHCKADCSHILCKSSTAILICKHT